jgi:hypothetical protein
MNKISATKQYKCKECKQPYTKRNSWQTICGETACIVETVYKSQAKREKLERKVTKEKLKKFATKPELAEKVKIAFNAYIRARDYGQPCISCDRPIAWGTTNTTGGVCDAGHWLSVGARVNLRFNEDNVHAQCKHCNKELSGNAANYRIRLVKKIGLDRVEALECDHKLNHYSKDDLREIESIYKAKLKQLRETT